MAVLGKHVQNLLGTVPMLRGKGGGKRSAGDWMPSFIHLDTIVANNNKTSEVCRLSIGDWGSATDNRLNTLTWELIIMYVGIKSPPSQLTSASIAAL